MSDGVAVGDLIPGREALLEKGAWMDRTLWRRSINTRRIVNEANRASVSLCGSWLPHMFLLSPDYRDHFGKFVMALQRGSTLDDSGQVGL